ENVPTRTRGETRVGAGGAGAWRDCTDRDFPAGLDLLGIAASARAQNAVARKAVHRSRQLCGDRQGPAFLGGAWTPGVLHCGVDLAGAVDRTVSGAGDESRFPGPGIRARSGAGSVGNS